MNAAYDLILEGIWERGDCSYALNYITHNSVRASTATARMLRYRGQAKIAAVAQIALLG